VIRPGIRRFFRLTLLRRDITARNVDEEIRAHLEMRAEQLVGEGLSPDEAREEALRRFGSLEAARRDLREHAHQRERTMQFREWFEALRQDIRYAARGLRREPAFTAFVVGTLALGIGANAAMFGIVDRLLLRGPDHVRDPNQVVRFYLSAQQQPGRAEARAGSFGYVTYGLLRASAHSFSSVAAYRSSPGSITMGRGVEAQRINLGEATADFFPLLGVQPQVGRFYSTREDSPTGPARVVVLGHGLWQRAFGGDRDVVGKSIMLADEQYTIIGVAPSGFTGPDLTRVDVWMPMSVRSRTIITDWTHGWNAQWLYVIGRLNPGVTHEQATAEATALYRAAYTGNEPGMTSAKLNVAPIRTTRSGFESTEATVSRWLVGVAVIVLLVACSNAVNLLLARAVRRRREVAVRLALGAGRWRLVRLLLTEGLMLAAASGMASLAVAYGFGALVRSVLLPDIEWTSSPVDVRVMGLSAIVALTAGLLVGLVPALQASKPDVAATLKAGAREGGGRRARLRNALTVAQAALSVLLLVGAGLFVRSLRNVRALDLGIQPDRVLVVTIQRPSAGPTFGPDDHSPEELRRKAFYLAALAHVRAMPGVERASLTVGLPFMSGFSQTLRVPGWDSLPGPSDRSPNLSAVSDGYFETTGTRVLRGRSFTPADRAGSESVALVSATMAATLWPGRDPIGTCIYTGEKAMAADAPCARIIGIVGDAHSQELREPPSMHYYVPLGQEQGMGGTQLLVRPTGDPSRITERVRKDLIALDPTISFVKTELLQEEVDPQIRPWRLGASMFSLMGVLALVVASLGLYSVMSYFVAQRTHELGVRIALGAGGSDIASLVLRSGAGMAALGIVIGVGLAVALSSFIEPLLFDTSARDITVIGTVVCTLLAVALLASLVPAVRAKNTNPMEALRTE
jgi:predicted permease